MKSQGDSEATTLNQIQKLLSIKEKERETTTTEDDDVDSLFFDAFCGGCFIRSPLPLRRWSHRGLNFFLCESEFPEI